MNLFESENNCDMAKDPAFLFYPGDWISGTLGMTFEEKGAYMEFLMYQFNRGSIPESVIKRMLNVRFEDVWPTIQDKFIKDMNGDYYNIRLRFETEKRKKFTESRRDSRLKADEDAVKLYVIKDLDTKMCKIGSSVNPLRRFAEMCNQKNPAIAVGCRNYQLLWQSEIVLRTEEAIMHTHFEKQRIVGEWFNLSDEDLGFLKNRYGTYVQRTENENVNTNTDELKTINVSFDDFWDLYDKKVGLKTKLSKKWEALKSAERIAAMEYIPKYKAAEPDKGYRKNPDTFLNNKSWNDELIYKTPSVNGSHQQSSASRNGKSGGFNKLAARLEQKIRTQGGSDPQT